MNSRISITLLICMVGALITIAGLFLPARDTSPSSDQPASEPASTSASSEPVQVEIINFGFSATSTLSPGQTVVVVNNDSAPHTLTADDGSFDTGLLEPGDQASIVVPDAAGTYTFFCEVHPSMTGGFDVSP